MKRGLLSPTPMKKVEILALDQHRHKLTWVLGELGVMHLTTAPYTPGAAGLQERDHSSDLALCREIIAAIDLLAEQVGLDLSGHTEQPPYVPLKRIRALVSQIEEQAQQHLDQRDIIEARIAELKQMLGEVEPIRRLGVPLRRLKELSFVHFASGQISERELPHLQNEVSSSALIIPLQEAPGKSGSFTVAAVSSRKGRFALDSALEKHNFAPEELSDQLEGIPAEVCTRLTEELDGQSMELRKVNLLLAGIAERHGADLISWRTRAESEIEVIHAQNHFSRTRNTFLINGWVPEERIGELQRATLDETEGVAVIDVSDPDEAIDEVPTQIKHAPWLQPFAMLVKAYGFPGYREVEPTLMVAVSFLVMFGIMFGDVGHGLILLIIGLVVRRKATEAATRDFAAIIAYAGGASMIFGTVYASVFGIASIEEKYALIRPMAPGSMMPFLGATVAFGALLICVGLLMNIVNRLRSDDYYNGVLGRTGIIGAIFYTGVLGLGIRAYIQGADYDFKPWHAILFVALPLVIIFLREPIYALITRKSKLFHEGVFGGIMEAGVEVMETISSFVSNTASFARVGAFALGHAGLCMAIFEMVEIVRKMPGGPFIAALVLIFGNALIIVLEGMVVGIQVVRLEYYEFFTKFFTGSGRAYQPFHLSKSARPNEAAD